MKQYCYSFYSTLFCLLFASAMHAQTRVPDMKRFTGEGAILNNNVAAAAPKATALVNASAIPDMSLFTKAPILKGGAGANAALRSAAPTKNADLPSDHIVIKNAVRKTDATPQSSEAAMEQLKLPTPALEASPAGQPAVKPVSKQ
jgi:hypothetical protein